MKLNTDKCHLLILDRNSNQQITVNVGDSVRKYGRGNVTRRCDR